MLLYNKKRNKIGSCLSTNNNGELNIYFPDKDSRHVRDVIRMPHPDFEEIITVEINRKNILDKIDELLNKDYDKLSKNEMFYAIVEQNKYYHSLFTNLDDKKHMIFLLKEEQEEVKEPVVKKAFAKSKVIQAVAIEEVPSPFLPDENELAGEINKPADVYSGWQHYINREHGPFGYETSATSSPESKKPEINVIENPTYAKGFEHEFNAAVAKEFGDYFNRNNDKYKSFQESRSRRSPLQERKLTPTQQDYTKNSENE